MIEPNVTIEEFLKADDGTIMYYRGVLDAIMLQRKLYFKEQFRMRRELRKKQEEND